MDNKFQINDLLDFYGPLLTDYQRKICNYYYGEDYSLQEIADEENISRSAVYDTLKRCRKELEEYENKLHLADAYKKRHRIYEQMKKHASVEMLRLIDECMNTEID